MRNVHNNSNTRSPTQELPKEKACNVSRIARAAQVLQRDSAVKDEQGARFAAYAHPQKVPQRHQDKDNQEQGRPARL